jgi:hypothetical protein
MTVTELPVKAKPKRKAKVWIPPTAADFYPGRVIGIDQSLAACGVVALVCDEYGPMVVEAVVLKTASVAVGSEDSLQRAVALGAMLRVLLGGYSRAEWAVAHEAPPLGGRGVSDRLGTLRPESSWLSALALRMTLQESGHELRPMVDGIRWKKIVSGNGHSKKAAAHKLMATWAPQVVGNMDKITNEPKRDALAVALATLWRH